MCVNRDCTVYFNAHTLYGMYTTHCVIWYLVEAVELVEVPIPYSFKIPKYTIIVGRNGLLSVSPFEIS